MTLMIQAPASRRRERQYVLHVLLDEFLGLDWRLRMEERTDVRVTLLEQAGELYMPDELLSVPESLWQKPASMPTRPLAVWQATELGMELPLRKPDLPVLYGSLCGGVMLAAAKIALPVDIFGSAFYMLTRYEESVGGERDQHDRFPARASIAYREGFLDRPIVDEYVEVLWACARRLWPQLRRRERRTGKFITCDVDWPYEPVRRSVWKTVRASVSAIKNGRGIQAAGRKCLDLCTYLAGDASRDPYKAAIDWIMKCNEDIGNRVAFFFIVRKTHELDGVADFESEEVRRLLREISARGHEIGLHPGYNCYNNEQNLAMSVETLKRVLREEGIRQPVIGSRMHFLRWDGRTTPRLLEKYGITYDSTLGFPDIAGFRCGTSFEYTMYDVSSRTQLALKERPLVTMESTIIAERHENMGYSDEALKRFLDLKCSCQWYQGQYTLLWHNSHFGKREDKAFYLQLIA